MNAVVGVALALTLLFIACSFMAAAAQVRRSPGLEAWNLAAAVTCTELAVLFALAGAIGLAVALVGLAALRWWLWWKGRRGKRRKRSLKALGHKARARLAALAANMPRPGPALRPVPQGARA